VVDSSGLLLLFLTGAVLLSWYAGRGNAKISAYLTVFHEKKLDNNQTLREGWEDRLGRFSEKLKCFDKLTLSHWLGAIYFLLGGVSVVLPWLAGAQHFPPSKDYFVHAGIPAAVFLFVLILLVCSSPRTSYIKRWEDVETDEKRPTAPK
jgi:hypothetical protein